MEPEPFLLGVHRLDKQVVVAVRGELDGDTAPQLQQMLEDLIVGQGNMSVVVDLSHLTFLDSTGIRTLVGAGMALHPEPLTLIAPSRHVRRVLDICGLAPIFTICDRSPLPASH